MRVLGFAEIERSVGDGKMQKTENAKDFLPLIRAERQKCVELEEKGEKEEERKGKRGEIRGDGRRYQRIEGSLKGRIRVDVWDGG